MMPELAELFTPGKIGNLTLRNRIVCAAMGTGLCHPEGYTTPQYTAFLTSVARGGAGLIITGVTRVVSDVGMRPGSMGIYHDKFIPGLQTMVKEVQSQGARIFLQLHHPGTRGSEDVPGIPTVAPSALRHPRTGVTPKELSVKDIRDLVERYGEAAARVKQAGFDGVEVHGGHGYLICQFLSPRDNRRTDSYGGSNANRARFAVEIVRRVREVVGPDFPVCFRISGDEFIGGGTTIEDTIEHVHLLVAAGIDAIHVSAGSGGCWTTPNFMHPPAPLAHLAAAVKKTVKLPVIAVGKLGDPALANRVLAEGQADFIALGRPLLADAELPNKAQRGELDDIRRCLYCCNGCIHNRLEGRNRCAVNPVLGQELAYQPSPAARPRKIMVIGGGLAGMEAAVVLAERGHRVTLCEKTTSLGGQWNVASAVSPDLATITAYLSRKLAKAGVEVCLETPADVRLVLAKKPDAVVVATGATQRRLDIPGADGAHVVMANDVLTGKAAAGDEVVIIGGRLVGLETARFLAAQGKKVSVVSRRKIARDVARLLKITLLEDMVRYGVNLYADALPEMITAKGIAINYDGEALFLEADTIVIAVGSAADDRLTRELEERAPDLTVRVIGDCVTPRDALTAIHEGFKAGSEL
ncbi:MAG: FAD-dependent oxidoreductase [Chloroflexota bacterium]